MRSRSCRRRRRRRCARRGAVRSSVGRRRLRHRVDDRVTGIGRAPRRDPRAAPPHRAGRPPRRGAHRVEPIRLGEQLGHDRVEPRAGRTPRRARRRAAPACSSVRAFCGLVIAGRTRQRHEHRRHTGHRELGDGPGAGPAHRQRRTREQRLHVRLVGNQLVRHASPSRRCASSAAAHSISLRGPQTWCTVISVRSRHRS